MKILFLTISYSINGGTIYNDLVDCLIEHGHEIVVCRSSLDNSIHHIEDIKKGLTLLNVKTGNQFEKNLIKKGINMILLENQFISAIRKCLNGYSFDLILYATPPISFNGVIQYCKKKFEAKSFLMLKDIFPQNAVDLGMMKKGSYVYNYFSKKEKKLYDVSDYIGCMSNKNVEYLNKYDIEIQKKAHIFYNSIKIHDTLKSNHSQNEITTFLFGGNLGKPQNIKFLLSIVEELKTYSKARFIIVGKGTEDLMVKKYAESNLKNFSYIPFLEKKEYDKLLLNCDIGIISLDPRFTIANIPSKLPTYYLYKKPVLAITDEFTDLREMVEKEKCGWWCSSNDRRTVIKVIKEICKSKPQQIQRGLNAYGYVKRLFDVETNVEQIEKFMEEKNNE